MVGRVPRALQVEAARRARALYEALGQPRRVFSSLIQLSRASQRAGARTQPREAALDEARGLIRPDWPAEFHLFLLRRDGSLARDAGQFAEALALFREAVRLSASTRDWRLEVIAGTTWCDLLWERRADRRRRARGVRARRGAARAAGGRRRHGCPRRPT